MAAGVPPPPLNSPSGSYYWLEWYTNLTNFLNGTNIPWSNLNFTNSNLTDIQNRSHQDLQQLQGGAAQNRYHMAGVGFVDATATNVKLPSGWTAAHTGTGLYTVTHNLGLSSPDYMAGGTSNATGFIVASIDTTNTNLITVRMTNFGGTLSDAAFSFWISDI